MIEKLSNDPNAEALTWLFEMEMVNNPYVLNSLVLNLMAGIKGVKDIELVIDEKQKKILVFLKLRWFYDKFKKKPVEDKAKELLEQILPSFKKRVIFDRKILEKALKVSQAR